MDSNIFFTPRKGDRYLEGIRGHKVMVLGASHFCKQTNCNYHSQCTDSKCKDSSPYNLLCEFSDVELKNTTRNDIDNFIVGNNSIEAYKNFSNFIVNETDFANSPKEVFSLIVFYNFIQFFQPEMKTKEEYISERDYLALLEVIKKYTPELIIVWGTEVGNYLKKKGSVKTEIKNANQDYLFRIPTISKSIMFLNIYHPCDLYKHFSNDIDNFKKYLSLVINYWNVSTDTKTP